MGAPSKHSAVPKCRARSVGSRGVLPRSQSEASRKSGPSCARAHAPDPLVTGLGPRSNGENAHDGAAFVVARLRPCRREEAPAGGKRVGLLADLTRRTAGPPWAPAQSTRSVPRGTHSATPAQRRSKGPGPPRPQHQTGRPTLARRGILVREPAPTPDRWPLLNRVTGAPRGGEVCRGLRPKRQPDLEEARAGPGDRRADVHVERSARAEASNGPAPSTATARPQTPRPSERVGRPTPAGGNQRAGRRAGPPATAHPGPASLEGVTFHVEPDRPRPTNQPYANARGRRLRERSPRMFHVEHRPSRPEEQQLSAFSVAPRRSRRRKPGAGIARHEHRHLPVGSN